VVVLFVNGALDARSAAGLTRTLDEIWSQPFASLWVDLAGTDRLDEAGLDVLLRARERAVASDREFLIRSPSTEAVRALERSAAWPLLGGG
jgi:anti-anti-sigma regulatory factor